MSKKNHYEKREIHYFDWFSVVISNECDYYLEFNNGDDYLILSPDGSIEHNRISAWIESPDRVESDFDHNVQDYEDYIEEQRLDAENDYY